MGHKTTLRFPTLGMLCAFKDVIKAKAYRILIIDVTITFECTEDERNLATSKYQAKLVGAAGNSKQDLRFIYFSKL